MPVPIVYRAGGDVQVTYDFADIVSGTGYISFYPAAGYSSNMFLSRDSSYGSQPISTEGQTSNAAYTKVVDVDFDYVIDRPLTLKGEATINQPWALDDGPNPGSADAYLIVKIRKWDGTTETTLVQGVGDTYSRSGGSSKAFKWLGLGVTVPQTHFKKGETLRYTVEGWLRSSTGTAALDVAHDPKARTNWDPNVNPVTSQSVIQIPLRIDI